jgi:uncharacterized protein YgiM (DUF1202 family)
MSEDVFVVSKYDYTAIEPQELSFKKNERFKLIDDSKNWWKVENEQGNSGFVPSNFVRKESFVDKAKGTFKGFGKNSSKNSTSSLTNGKPFSDQNGSEHSIPSQQNNIIAPQSSSTSSSSRMMSESSYATAKYNYDPQRPDELRLERGNNVLVIERSSDGWWKGECNGETGWFPSNYVEPAPDPSPVASIPQQQPYAPDYTKDISSAFQNGTAAHAPILEVVTTLYDFDAQNAEELSFRKGEKLDIIEHPLHDPEWWKARNAHGLIGLVPTNYIKVQANGANASSTLTGPYANKEWYFGAISRNQGEQLLNQKGIEGDFLVRDSESNIGDYSISLKGNIRNMHFWVRADHQVPSFQIGNRTFNSMEQLINHYKSSPIFNDDKSRETLYLVRALPRY